jgi:ribosomal protein S12 methylthiotransferase accessory factor
MRGLGITRLANLTGLDVVGIPVVQAVRPNARSNAVSQGKGIDLASAKTSAMMEAIETYYAERTSRPTRFGSTCDMQAEGRVADVERLPQVPGSRYRPQLDMLWIEGHDLSSHAPVWVPFETVHARFKVPYPPGSGCFPMSTNGLASGNCRIEAVIHGLTEVIERDATTLFELHPDNWISSRLDLSSVDDADCRALIEMFERAGILVAAWDITSDTGLPAFLCHVLESEDGPGLLSRPAEGHGCHPDRTVALTRALTEAAQARVTVISGARDDIARDRYGRAYDMTEIDAWRRMLRDQAGPCRFTDVDSFVHPTFDADLTFILARLQACGVEEAIVVDLSPRESAPFAVVRVVVPGLEAILGTADIARARANSRARRTG